MVYYEEGLEVVPNGDDAPCVKSVEDPDPKTGHQYPCETADKYLAVNTNEPKTSFHEDNLEQQKGTKDTEDFTRRRRRICGLPRMWFWILLGVCGLIVIGAALGAGVGVGLMKSESSERYVILFIYYLTGISTSVASNNVWYQLNRRIE